MIAWKTRKIAEFGLFSFGRDVFMRGFGALAKKGQKGDKARRRFRQVRLGIKALLGRKEKRDKEQGGD